MNFRKNVQIHTDQAGQTAEFAAQAETTKDKWEAENHWILEQLSPHVDSFKFDEIVASRKEHLDAIPFPEQCMRVRKLCWIPDEPEDATSQNSDQIRAVYGHAVLLASRYQGVDGDLFETYEHAESTFHALGIAVQQDQGLRFYRLFTSESGKTLYDILGHRYGALIAKYNAQVFHVFTESDIFDPSPDEERLRKGMENRFQRNMREIGDEPTHSYNLEDVQMLNSMLLGTPKKPGYSEQLVGLIDTPLEVHRNQIELTTAFDAYLGDSPIINNRLQAKQINQ